MKRVLITGARSYIGNHLARILPDATLMSVRDDAWKAVDFSSYDVIVHAAGIVHKAKNHEDIMAVNCDLTLALAQKARKDGVKQFIFLSTIMVYGQESGYIDASTIPQPKTDYAKSKYCAELKLWALNTVNFRVLILRVPFVYGYQAKGNYRHLARFAKMMPLFPQFNTFRSMIHIDNLCECMRIMVKYENFGLFVPQNNTFVSVQELVRAIASVHNHRIWVTPIFNPLIRLFRNTPLFKKVFTDLMVDMSLSNHPQEDYRIHGFQRSVVLTERNDRQ